MRFPAEFEHQAAVWFAFPHAAATWVGRLADIQLQWARFVATAQRFEPVRIIAPGPSRKRLHEVAREVGLRLDPDTVVDLPTNDAWLRDTGPTFVKDDAGTPVGIDWRYNAWGGKFPPWDDDEALAARLGETVGFPVRRSELVAEGGGLETNGAGVLLTTDSVLLNPNRNPDWSRAELEAELKQQLGVTTVFWLERGFTDDDTDGHIDMLTRFVREDVVVTVTAKPGHPDHRQLAANRERLQDLCTVAGSRVEVLDLPVPLDPVHAVGARSETLPASYANFLILNGAVLVPGYEQPRSDDRARGILRECFPDREVISIPSVGFLSEGGALHCLSQHQPG